jgi:hypothetical protein
MTVEPPPDFREEVGIVRIDPSPWKGSVTGMQAVVWPFSSPVWYPPVVCTSGARLCW